MFEDVLGQPKEPIIQYCNIISFLANLWILTMSIFNGKLEEIPEITIDRFDGERNLNGSTAYFLTHCHSDHMIGLEEEEFRKSLCERNGVYLYASKITCRILKNHQNYRHLNSKIKSLESIGCNILSIPCLADATSFIELQVTLIPAGHCPGSVMFFFELQQGNVLYTGDFRFARKDLCTLDDLHHKEGTPKEISALYLDTTFFDDLHPTFPTREESFEKVCNLSKEWLEESPCNEVLIDIPARYGAEFIFCELKNKLGMKVHVSQEKVYTFKAVKEISAAITDDRSMTRIHACAYKRVLPLECKRSNVKFLTIRVSCMWYEKDYAVKGDIVSELNNYIRVCYACHCSKEELVHFINYFLPKKVVACAIPADRTAVEVEKEIMNLIWKFQKNSRSLDSSDTPEDHKISYSMKCQVKRKIMASPRKKRHFAPLTPEISSAESSPYLYSTHDEDLQTSGHQEKIKVDESLVSKSCPVVEESEKSGQDVPGRGARGSGELEQASEKKEVTGSSCESELEPSPSLLPQFSRKTVDPTKRDNWSPECYLVCRDQEETAIEVITLSSDESPEIFVME